MDIHFLNNNETALLSWLILVSFKDTWQNSTARVIAHGFLHDFLPAHNDTC